jgi:REP element-mobilizing transposase RayT
LTALGRIVRECWIAIPSHFGRVNLHSFVIMPNHLHGIVEIVVTGAVQHASRLQGKQATATLSLQAGSLSVVVRSFKAEVTRRGQEELRWESRIWQPNYFDRVVRDGREFADASRYIAENPSKWDSDLENPYGVVNAIERTRRAQHAARLQGTPESER